MSALNRSIGPAALAAVCIVTNAHAQESASRERIAQSGTAVAVVNAGVSSADRQFVLDAARSGLTELHASETALNRVTDPAVRRFAQRMVEDHKKANAELRRIANELGLPMPTDPSFVQQARLHMLGMTSHDDFDQRYVADFGLQAHHDAIALFRKQTKEGQERSLKRFAEQTLATLQHHLQMAQSLQSSLQARRQGLGQASGQPVDVLPDSGHRQDALRQIDDAVQVVQHMKRLPALSQVLRVAKGVFILPHYRRGALAVGVQAGEGVFVSRQGDGFSNPVFYNLESISIGAQAGAAGGEVALLLMTDRAVANFMSGKKFSLFADAGLTVAQWSRRAHTSGGKVQDVIVWPGTQGAYAGASLGIANVELDDDANRAYYGRRNVSPDAIVGGSVPNPHNNVLGLVLQA
jgi:SH3 domain-containing YSC84-like protein 1